ncbi:hypothetical protein F5Y05DRAFT_416658 [Hypoxylon sp. FL0543]|nr:hypothetical protein F5Y05DRAFT_416658 [Hypoxylon sp. FL0543]
MEQKDEKSQVSKEQDQNTVTPRVDGLPTTSQPRSSLEIVPLDRPWADPKHAVSHNLQGPSRKVTAHGGSAFERWSVQPMTDEPYQNVKSIITKTYTGQPKDTDNHSPKHSPAPSQTAATSGSR